jgi:hypothetical protein
MPSQSPERSTGIAQQSQQSASIHGYETLALPETDGSRTAEPKSITAPSQRNTTQPGVRLAARQLSNAIWARTCSFVHKSSSQGSSSRASPRILSTEARDGARDEDRDRWRSSHNKCKQQVGLASECLDVTKEIAKEIKQDKSWKGQPSARRIGSQAVEKAKDRLETEKEWMAYVTKQGRKAGSDLGNSIYAPSVPSELRETVESNFSDVSCVAGTKEIISPEERTDYMSGVEQLLKERFPDTMVQ